MAFVLEINPEDSGSEPEFHQMIDEECDNGEDNIGARAERNRSTKEQLNILDSAMDRSDGIDEKGWNVLAAHLNNIGPPIRDVDKWKRVWSIRKYNRKQGQQIEAKPPVNLGSDNFTPATPNVLYSDVLKKLDVITQWLEKVETQLKQTNSLLQIIAGKFS